jgi:hypothetical protein
MNGESLPPGTWIVGVSPVQLDDGRVLMWHSPQPVAFNLIESKAFRDRGVRARRSIMGNLARRPKDGPDRVGPRDSRAPIDCISDLQAGVLSAFTAIESLANHVIDMLDDDATLTRKGRVVAQSDMVRELGIDDKLKLVVPLADGGARIAGSAVWDDHYRPLKFLRDELLHVKERGMDPDPNVHTAYDRLMLGQGDTCVEDATAVVEGAWPGFLPEQVRHALALT